MSGKRKLIIVGLFILLLIVCIFFSSNKNVEIALVGEIPKVFPAKDLSNDVASSSDGFRIPSVVSDNTVYLTFDDGPSYLTDEILDILKSENVVATFFVVGSEIDKYKDVVKRAYDDGHTVAIHSYTHNYSYIYSSEENYFNDLNMIKTKVYQITGNNPRIVRLPGGSSNTVSKRYNDMIITRIVSRLNDKEYYYFDWNVDSKDASGKLSSDEIYFNTISSLHEGNNIVLMHDAGSKMTTVLALDRIIKYAKDNGYTFARITKDTKPIHHRINN